MKHFFNPIYSLEIVTRIESTIGSNVPAGICDAVMVNLSSRIKFEETLETEVISIRSRFPNE